MSLSRKIGPFVVPAGVPALPLANALIPRLEAAGAVSTKVAQLPWDPLVAFVRVGLSGDGADTEAYAVHTGDLASLRALAEFQLSMMQRRGPVTLLSAVDVPVDVAVLLDGGVISKLLAGIAHVVHPDMPLSQTLDAARALRPLFEAAFGVSFGDDLESTCAAIDDCVMRLRPGGLGASEEIDNLAKPRLALMALGLIANAAVLKDYPNALSIHMQGLGWTPATTLADAKGFPTLRVDHVELVVRLPMLVLSRWHRGEHDTVVGEARAFRLGVATREMRPSEVVDHLRGPGATADS